MNDSERPSNRHVGALDPRRHLDERDHDVAGIPEFLGLEADVEPLPLPGEFSEPVVPVILGIVGPPWNGVGDVVWREERCAIPSTPFDG